jgi:hypothetical protein
MTPHRPTTNRARKGIVTAWVRSRIGRIVGLLVRVVDALCPCGAPRATAQRRIAGGCDETALRPLQR